MDIHRCRFVPYNPQAINALSFSHPSSLDLAGRGVPTLRLAVGRANGDIEIWNPLRGAWFQETVLRGGKDRSIEGLTWTLDPAEDIMDGSGTRPGRLRLFSIGYSNTVTEWDLEQGRPARHSGGNYGEIWCLAAQPCWNAVKRKDGKPLHPAEGEYTGQHLAAGCADGSIVILSTADNDLKFLRIMRPSTKRARVLSITFQSRNVIAAGYADSSIRLFDIRNGRLLRTISLGRGPIGGPTGILVWSVRCLPDGTIVSGDSTGEVRFWDGKNYSLIQRLQGHQADILDIAVSADGESVISGGADQRTVVYRLKEGEKGDKKRRWAELMHRRYHTHDVKAFAVYETKDISVVVSGGPDAAPVVLPLREFGKEHHRKLSPLPQLPQLTSAPSRRLLMSFWDQEVRIWRVPRKPTHFQDNPDGQKYLLVGKILLQGEDNITSATLSPDGSFLAVATVTCVRVFSLRRQKGIEKDILRVRRLDVPPELAKDGARLVCISPDSRWLCVVRPNSDILLVRIQPASAQARSRIISNVSKLRRVPRYSRYEKPSHGTLGNFDRTIRTVVFSEDSRILASGDLSGCVDIWLLESVGELLSERPAKKVNQTASSDDESSDDEDEQPIFDGERWQLSLRETPIPRLGSGVILMLFRPPRLSQPALLTDGENHSPSGNPENNICLMVITSDHRLVEFDVQSGKYSDWARRNPKAYLPAEFTSIKDRAMGGIWDSNEGRERLWLYGTSWLWMFDLEQDFPPPENAEAATKGQTGPEVSGQLIKSSSLKRKRELDYEEDDIKGKSNSGAGDRISRSQADISLGAKFKKIVGKDESQGEWVSFRVEHQQDIIGEDEDERDDFVGSSDSNFAMLRRDYQGVEKVDSSQSCHNTGVEDTEFFRIGQKATSVAIVSDNSSSNHVPPPNEAVNGNVEGGPASPSQQQMMEAEHDTSPQLPRRWWYTFKYRDILGIVQLRSPSESDEDNEEIKPKHGNNHFEVVIVERPMWDVNLPGRYLRDYE